MIYISKTNTGKENESQILLHGGIYFNFVQYTKHEGKFTEDLRYVIAKARI